MKRKRKGMRAASIVARMTDEQLTDVSLIAVRMIAAKPGPDRIAWFMLLEENITKIKKQVRQ